MVCSSGAEFTLNNLPAVDSIIWITGPDLDITTGQGYSECTISATGSGSSLVQAELITACDTITLPGKVVWAGQPYINPSSIQFECVEGGGYLCTNAYGNEFSFSSVAPYSYFNIKLTNYSETQTYCQFTIHDTWGTLDCAPPEGTHMFHVRGNNACGTATNWSKKAVYFSDCGGGGGGGLFEMIVYPNPSTNETRIAIVSTKDDITILQKGDKWKIEVYSQNNILKFVNNNIMESTLNLNTSGWPTGVYFIKAFYRDEILTRTLIVSK